jgi:hypothetical protein
MRIGYMWVVRLGLTFVRLMDRTEQGDKEQLSGVIMKASYGEMREGRKVETCAPFEGSDTRKEIQEPGVTCEPKCQPWHLREIGI